MTHRHLAFLRGLNVGGHTVKMDVLRALFEELDFAEVATFIASGNVIFHSPERDQRHLETRIETHLEERLGYEVLTFVRSASEVTAMAEFEPFPDEEPQPIDTVHIGFLKASLPADACRVVAGLSNDQDRLRVEGRELYWRIHGGVTSSSLKDSDVAAALGGRPTMRNRNTVRRLAARYAAPA